MEIQHSIRSEAVSAAVTSDDHVTIAESLASTAFTIPASAPELTSPNTVSTHYSTVETKDSIITETIKVTDISDATESQASTEFAISASASELTRSLTIPSPSSVLETRHSLTTEAISVAVNFIDQVRTAESVESPEFPISTSTPELTLPITIPSDSSALETKESIPNEGVSVMVRSEDSVKTVESSASSEIAFSASAPESISPATTVSSQYSIMKSKVSIMSEDVSVIATPEDQTTAVESSASTIFPIVASTSELIPLITSPVYSSTMKTTGLIVTETASVSVTSKDQVTTTESSSSSDSVIYRSSSIASEADLDFNMSCQSFHQLSNFSVAGMKPPDFRNEVLTLTSSIKLMDSVSSHMSNDFLRIAADELNKTFSGLPGLNRTIVNGIKSSMRFRRWIASQLEIDFTLELLAREAVPKWELVRDFMRNQAAERLSRLSINGTKPEPNDADATADHLYNQTAPLQLTCDRPQLKGICPLCHRCLGYGAWMACFPQCDESRNEMCSVIDVQKQLTECHCRREFVLIGGDCIHRDFLVAVVFGCVCLLILLFLLIFLCKRKPWRKIKKYTVNYLPKTFFSGRNRGERVKMVHFHMLNQSEETEPRKWPSTPKGKLNLGFMGDSAVSLEEYPGARGYPTLTKTEALTAVFEDDRISFGSTDGAALDQEMESYKNYSSSLDNFNLLKDGSSYGDLEAYF